MKSLHGILYLLYMVDCIIPPCRALIENNETRYSNTHIMKYFRKYDTVKEALDFEVEHNNFVITGWPFIPAVQIQTASGTDTNFERHHVHTKVGPSFNAGYFSDDFSNQDNYGRKVYLPNNWILLSYIENTVAAGGYIDTGYAPSMTSTDTLTTLDFDITFAITTLPSSGNTSTVFSICGQTCTINSSGNISFAGATVSTALSVNTKYTVHIHWGVTSGTTGNVSMSVFNVTDLTSTDKLIGSATSTSQTLTAANLVLFDATAGLVGRMYYFGVYEDNDIKLDMVPVVGQDNMAGMYNIRSAEFMGNSRTVTGPMYMTRTVGDIVDSTTGYQVTSTGEYAKIDSLKGNSIVWNQAVPNSGTTTVTLTSGNKYYTKINDSSSIVTGSGNSQSVTGGSDIVCDLTKMFGATIANDMTVTRFESMFPADYYPYNEGELLSFEGESLKTTDVVLGEHSTDISAWKDLKDPSDPSKPLFPYGLCSAGDVRDEVTATQAIKRVDSSGSTYTVLSNPIVVDLPSRQDYSYPVSTSTVESIQPDNALLSSGETKPYTAPAITTNNYSNYYSNRDKEWYGIRIDVTNSSSTGAVTREAGDMDSNGNSKLHTTLPVHTRMRRCIVDDDGNVVYYLHPMDSRYKACANGVPINDLATMDKLDYTNEEGYRVWEGDSPQTENTSGTYTISGVPSSDLTGGDGQVMVEIPEFYINFHSKSVNGTYTYQYARVSTIPIVGYMKVPTMYIGAFRATLNTTGGNTKLCSVWNNDSTSGYPTVSTTMEQFRVYARNRKNGSLTWNQYTYAHHKALFWLYYIEYANLNCQDTFNSARDAKYYHQGGLGAGISSGYSSSIYSIATSGYSLAKGNITQTQVLSTSMDSAIGRYRGTGTPTGVSYRGIEDPFAHIWTFVDGVVCYRNDVYVYSNPEDFSKLTTSTTTIPSDITLITHDHWWSTSDAARGNTATSTYSSQRGNNYISGVVFDSLVERPQNLSEYGGVFLGANTSNGSATTYFGDYQYTSNGVHCLLLGGYSVYGTNAGFAFSNSIGAFSFSYVTVGARLTLIK